jgi:hypothetical protein
VTRVVAAVGLALLLAACNQPAAQPDARQGANSERYNRDRDVCRAVADDYMKRRRNIDDGRREVFAGDYDRYGQGELRRDMENYGDTRSADRITADCMENRGWPQPQKAWWQKIGS